MDIVIGTKFIRRCSKRKDVETVVDILTTTNSKGEVVGVKYVASHDFMGQKVTDFEVASSTIMRAEMVALDKPENMEITENGDSIYHYHKGDIKAYFRVHPKSNFQNGHSGILHYIEWGGSQEKMFLDSVGVADKLMEKWGYVKGK
jgi:hypothetical protein